MTTNTTNSQAASIDTPEFRIRLSAVSWESRSAPSEAFEDVMNRLIAYIDAKLAQAREEGRRDSHETNVTMLNLKLKAEDRAATAEAKLAAWDKIVEASLANDYATRAIAAESRLAEIQRGVEGLTRYTPGLRWGVTGFEGDLSLVSRNEVLALLQPQGQADTSGLPG